MPAWLVVNADDLGVSKGANAGVLRAHREGIVTSASLCVTTASCAHAIETVVRACPELGVGLHFSLTLGSPAADRAKVPLLLDAKGRFGWTFSSLFIAAGVQGRAALLEQIGIELDAQFTRLESHGVMPDHVNGERHVHLIPGIFEIVADTARRRGIRFVRAGRDRGAGQRGPAELGLLTLGAGFVKSYLLSRLAERAGAQLGPGLSTPHEVASYLYTGRADVILPRLLEHPSDGITEVMAHPGIPEENGPLDLGSAEIVSYLNSPDRRRELDACVAARGHTGEWQLTNYRTLAAAAAARTKDGTGVLRLERAHVDSVAALHSAELTGLLSDLGPEAVRAYYEACAQSPLAIALVAVERDDVLGFVLGAVSHAALRNDLAQRNPFGVSIGMLAGFLRRPSTLPWLVKGVLGPEGGKYDTSAPELIYLAVRPDARGKGAGRMLVEEFARAMRNAGQSRYELSVDVDNREAIAFYEQFGLTRVGEYEEFGRRHARYRATL